MTTLSARLTKKLRRECQAVIGGVSFDNKIAKEVIEALAPRRKNEKQRATQKRKLQGAAARRLRSTELRIAVLARAAGKCELCGIFNPYSGIEVHHVEGGAGRRVEQQSKANCMGICTLCHRQWHHDGPAIFLPAVKQWAETHGYPLPSIIRKSEASAELPGRAAR